MFEYLEFRLVDGKPSGHDLKLFVLTTCTHCARALQYLEHRGFAYGVINGDELPIELKRRLRNDFTRSFHAPVRYPSLVIDDRTLVVGFERLEWEAALDGKAGEGKSDDSR